MSIRNEIERLKSDKEAIRRALTAKGVPQAAEHGFDDFAADIRSITAGTIPPEYGRVTSYTTYLRIE